MPSQLLWSWLERMSRSTQTWPSSSPWILDTLDVLTCQITSNNCLEGAPPPHTHICALLHTHCHMHNVIRVYVCTCSTNLECWCSVVCGPCDDDDGNLISSEDFIEATILWQTCMKSTYYSITLQAYVVICVNQILLSTVAWPWLSLTGSSLLKWCCTLRDSELLKSLPQRLFHSSSRSHCIMIHFLSVHFITWSLYPSCVNSCRASLNFVRSLETLYLSALYAGGSKAIS